MLVSGVMWWNVHNEGTCVWDELL